MILRANHPSGRPHVLIIEDEPLFARSLRRALARTCEPTVARGVCEAREALHGRHWDAFLVDVRLPDGYGIELLAPIRERHRHEPIVIMTGGSLAPPSLDALVHKAMLVPKPLPDEWLASFPAWLGGRESETERLASSFTAIGLSTRESEIFVELARGSSAEMAALRCNISAATVRAHCHRVYTRLGASSLAEVIAMANGWH